MRFVPLPLAGAFCIEDDPFSDHRGRFFRIYCEQELQAIGLNKPIAQANMSLTKQKGAVRGMHFQHPPHAECKIIRCLVGAVFDVIVDLRQGAATFLQWYGEILTPDSQKALFVPEGFAHGFQVLEEYSQLLYMHTHSYDPASEGAVRFNDPLIKIDWPLSPTDVSERDAGIPLLDQSFQGIKI